MKNYYITADGKLKRAGMTSGPLELIHLERGEEIKEGQPPEHLPTTSEGSEPSELRRRKTIKRKAGAAISSVMDDIAQRNSLAEMLALTNKRLDQILAPEEMDRLNFLLSQWQEIQFIREQSNYAEANGFAPDEFRP